jgi:enamine deaminase RidA (YjgF/YER057c/UK114 family)
MNGALRAAGVAQSRWPEPRKTPYAAAAGLPCEQVFTCVPRRDEALTDFIGRFSSELKQHQGTVLMVMAYGSVSAHDAVMEQLRRELGGIDWPMLWVEGASCFGAPLAGFQVFILPEGMVERVRVGGQVVGSVFSDAGARHCLLAGMGPVDVSQARAVQCGQLFTSVSEALGSVGFAYGDIARTWFYNDEILAWYDDFNRVRTAFYKTQKFTTSSLPASTAVLGRNPRSAALTFGAWAVVPVFSDVKVREIASPLQCPAPAYGSSFSRAMEISSGGRKRLLVSGTASIEPGGKTVWQGDAVKQIALTMEVVEAMLQPCGIGFGDVTRATAYFKHAADQKIFQSWLCAHALEAMPVVPVHCDICREDLLFEIELDACIAN